MNDPHQDQPSRPGRGRPARPARHGALAALAVLIVLAAATTRGEPRAAAPGEGVGGPGRAADLAAEARQAEEAGDYGAAAVHLRRLRALGPFDADLDLALALDLARTDSLEAARALLLGPGLRRAVADSCPPARRRPYGPHRDTLWTNGRYDGWRWTVARARAEVAARLGRWSEAREAVRLAVAERPLAGREWLLAAVCAAQTGDLAAAERQARLAAYLDPMVPESHYLAGLFDWRGGRRADALERFAAAVARDSLFEPAVRARQRLRFFPAAEPDPFPTAFLTGPRQADALTSPGGPKLGTSPAPDRDAVVLRRTMVPVPESLQVEIRPLRLVLPVLVDERGRPVLCDLPWISPEDLPAPLVALLLESLPGWEFEPARRFGQPVTAWTTVRITSGLQ